ncbi:DUF1194 domain-containing protein [Thalassococcus sp. BH17M4-6]|uniref:DUF1194 domain-containing protein n=1 Tax=Thalassococcus sp. BH17M4-6 TaxID=3413148 RepID=UPI003BDDC540
MVRLLGLLFLLWAAPLAAQGNCRLALLLALDVSSSVDAAEHDLQKTGVAAALDDPDIRHAILRGGPGLVALAAYEWSGRRQNAVVLDWTLLTDDAAIDGAVSTILAAPRSQTRFPTAMGYALGFGATLLRRAPACDRRVIDLSGDGISNDGFGPELAYRHFPFQDVTVNGLAVLGADPQVQDYFEDFVRFGAGAFVETATGYDGYRRAMTRKLYREINDLQVGSRAVPHPERPG